MPLSLPDLLRRPLRSHLERPAVTSPDGASLSYRELDRRSAWFARQLIGGGVARGDRVGLIVPKSVDAVVALWGILRAGAAYVPIDPASPPERAAMLVSDARVAAVVASERLPAASAAVKAAVPDALYIPVHGASDAGSPDRHEGGGEADGAFTPVPVTPRDLAYILYTSGSTGRPKGVMVSHSAALTFVEWAAWRFGLECGDVVGAHAPFHFDLSTFDLFATAVAGARLVLLDEETVRFPAACAQVLEAQGVTVLYAVPGALRRLTSHGGLRERRLELRTILFAGEVYPADELRVLQSCLPSVRLFNLFGPTETNVCTYWEVPPAGTWEHDVLPIGVDAEGCEGIVVDEDLRPVPDGTSGELLVRGGTLMEGYWGDPQRTKERLIEDFLRPELSDRLYRTGDLVTRGQDGVYAFHGRADHQVKVRGYRIELGEVEATLHRVVGLSDAAVVFVEGHASDGLKEGRLVAFLVRAGGDAGAVLDDAGVRHELAARLPRYMFPAELVWIDRLPLTSNGKVDRQRLSKMARDDFNHGS